VFITRKPRTQTELQPLAQQQQFQDAPATPATDQPPPADSTPAAEPASSDTTEATPPGRTNKVITMPTGRMAQLKREEREKGKRAALAALDADAKALGYASHEDMMQKLKASKGRPPATRTAPVSAPADDDEDQTPAAPPAPSGKGRQTRAERELARAQEQRRAANRARAAAEKRARALERQREADRAEHELRLVAVGAGVKDTDYALTILQRKLQNMSQAELEKFDEEKFFSADLRKSHPYLYETQQQPVTTSPMSDTKPVTTTPSATPPSKPAANTPAGDKKDARTMSKQEYDALLRARGLTPPQLGSPS
jgi:hypothetical protein